MPELVRNAAIFGALLLGLGVVGGTRWRIWGALLLCGASLSLGRVLGVLALGDITVLPAGSGLLPQLVVLVAWAAYAGVARAAGRPWVPGPAWLTAPVAGALLGEIPAAAMLAASARNPQAAARLALAAAAGAMVGRVGDPALAVMGVADGSVAWKLVPLAAVCLAISGVRGDDLVPDKSDRRLTAVAGLAALVAVVLAPLGLAVGVLGMGWLARGRLRDVDWRLPAWTLLAAVLALLVVAAGGPEFAASGLEQIHEEYLRHTLAPALTLGSALLCVLSDAGSAALLGQAVLDRALSMDVEGGSLAIAAGCAAGGLAPLFAAGATRYGLLRWLGQVGAAVVYVWLVAR